MFSTTNLFQKLREAIKIISNTDFLLIGKDDFLAKPERYSRPKTMCIANDELWFGYGYPRYGWGKGVSRFTKDGKLIQHYDTGSISDLSVNSLLYHDNFIWAATHKGAYKYLPVDNIWQQFEDTPYKDEEVANIIYKDNSLYIGSNQGLTILDLELETVDFRPLNGFYLTDICIDNTATAWFIYDSSYKERVQCIQGDKTFSPYKIIPKYPQKAVNIGDNYLAFGGWGDITLVQPDPGDAKLVEILSVEKKPGLLVRGICTIDTKSLWIIFFGLGSKLAVTCVYKDVASLLKKNLIDENDAKSVMSQFTAWVPTSQPLGMIYDIKIGQDSILYVASDELHAIDLREFLSIIP